MLDKLASSLSMEAQSLALRGKRQAVLTSNIANADTPGYKAVDFDFANALSKALAEAPQEPGSVVAMQTTHTKHFPLGGSGGSTQAMLQYRQATTGSLDGNTVDIEYERGQFAENAIKYEAALRDLSGSIKTLQTAITGGNNN